MESADPKLPNLRTRVRALKRSLCIPTSRAPRQQNPARCEVKWYEYDVESRRDLNQILIVVHPDGAVHAGRLKFGSPEIGKKKKRLYSPRYFRINFEMRPPKKRGNCLNMLAINNEDKFNIAEFAGPSYLGRSKSSIQTASEWEIYYQAVKSMLAREFTEPLFVLFDDTEGQTADLVNLEYFEGWEEDYMDDFEFFVFDATKNVVLHATMNWLGYHRGYEAYIHRGRLSPETIARIETSIALLKSEPRKDD